MAGLNFGGRSYTAGPNTGGPSWRTSPINGGQRTPNLIIPTASGALPPSLKCLNATGGTYINQTGVMETAAPNTPRVDWSTGQPILLVEPLSTNFQVPSQAIPASWGTGGTCTVTANGGNCIDGSKEAINIVLSGTFGGPYFNLPSNMTPGNVYTASCYVQFSGNVSGRNIYFPNNYGGLQDTGGQAFFDSLSFQSQGTYNLGGKIKKISSEWFYIESTFIHNPINCPDYTFYINGQSGDVFNIGSLQVEPGANATSYIYTTTASATRSADTIYGV